METTYKELKPPSLLAAMLAFNGRMETTYKELKQKKVGTDFATSQIVWRLPMRNLNRNFQIKSEEFTKYAKATLKKIMIFSKNRYVFCILRF